MIQLRVLEPAGDPHTDGDARVVVIDLADQPPLLDAGGQKDPRLRKLGLPRLLHDLGIERLLPIRELDIIVDSIQPNRELAELHIPLRPDVEVFEIAAGDASKASAIRPRIRIGVSTAGSITGHVEQRHVEARNLIPTVPERLLEAVRTYVVQVDAWGGWGSLEFEVPAAGQFVHPSS